MKLINSKVEILDDLNGTEILKKIERVARTCYKSEDRVSEDGSSAKKMVANLVKSGHESTLEFVDVTVRFTCDRITSQSIVRHRLASYAQESQRYCNYSKDKFNNEVTFIEPYWLSKVNKDIADEFGNALIIAESCYLGLLKEGCLPQEARAILPNATKTEINMKANLREWRHFFKLRCDTPAHPDIRKLAIDLLKQFHEKIPVIFDDLYDKFISNESKEV